MKPPSKLRERLAALELQRPVATHEGARERLSARLEAMATRLEAEPCGAPRAALLAALANAPDGTPRAALRRAVERLA